jgi:hypothetical protein
MKTPECKNCGSQRTSRIERKGFLQKNLLAGLGFYPWQCNSCWTSFYAKERGHRLRPDERRSKKPRAANSSE